MPRRLSLQRMGSLRALSHRDFALLWTGGLVSNSGSWMQTVAVGAFVVEATGQAVWAALVTVAAFLPIGLLSPVGGALADRLDRRRSIIVLDVVEAVLAALLALLAFTGRATPGSVTAVVLVAGCSSALRIPFQQSVLPDVVPRADLLAAVSMGSAQFNLGRVIGPALAGVIIAISSFGMVFLVNALSFTAAVVGLIFVRLPDRPPVGKSPMVRSIVEGARAARAEPGCRAAIALIALVAITASPFIALVPAVAVRLVGGGLRAAAAATGALTTAQGIGAVVGSLALVPLADRFGRRRALMTNLVVTPIALVAYANAPTLAWAVVAMVVVGASYIGVLSGLSTVVQLRAPDAFRGRILSLYLVALGTIYPLGALIQGVVADAVGLAPTTTATALALLAFVVVFGLARPTAWRVFDDVDDTGREDPIEVAPPVDVEPVTGFSAPVGGSARS